MSLIFQDMDYKVKTCNTLSFPAFVKGIICVFLYLQRQMFKFSCSVESRADLNL